MTTWGFLIYRLVDGVPQFSGILESQAKADDSVTVLSRIGQEWQVKPVPFLGWGFDAVFTNNSGAVVRGSALQ